MNNVVLLNVDIDKFSVTIEQILHMMPLCLFLKKCRILHSYKA